MWLGADSRQCRSDEAGGRREGYELSEDIEAPHTLAGAVQVPHRFDGAYLTLSSERAAEAARILGARAVVPIHFEGWTHFTQGADALRAAFAGNQLTDRLALAEPGASVTV
jgi:hypothetical protein